MNQSIAVINSIEFINLQPLEISPLMSACEIKVLYLGENRNHTFISKEVATEMAKTLRGCPIVGYFKTDTQDFGDHGNQVVFDENGISFNCLTKPYGFVSPDAKVWFQKFEEQDEFGNDIIREYLVTTGYVWTGQFEEVQCVVDEGRPHSMELDKKTLIGEWTKKINPQIEFFIINDALFSKLCILGEDVEPCFEGSSITTPETRFSLNTEFKNTLYSMMQDLEKVIKGGQTMEPEVLDTKEVVEESVVETVDPIPAEEIQEPVVETETIVDTPITEPENTVDTDTDVTAALVVEEPVVEDIATPVEETEPVHTENYQAKYEALVEEHSQLQNAHKELEAQFTNLSRDYEKLVEFKNKIENNKKDELIDSFSSLTDEEKEDVIKNKNSYSLEEIEQKLSVIYTRKSIALNDTNSTNVTDSPVVTFNVAEYGEAAPAWIAAIKNTKNNRN